jgi:hypothetical protein
VRHTSRFVDFAGSWPRGAQGRDETAVWAWSEDAAEPILATRPADAASLTEQRLPIPEAGLVMAVAAGANGAATVAVADYESEFVFWRATSTAALGRGDVARGSVAALAMLNERPVFLVIDATSRTRGALYANRL